MKTNYAMGDIKYYRKLHILRMRARGLEPVSYPQFYRRVRKMDLKTAIYTPRAEYQVRQKKETPIQDMIRRKATLKENRIPDIRSKCTRGKLLQKFISLFS